MTSLCGFLEESAARHPDRPAVVDTDGRAIGYAELDRRAAAIAGFLVASGISPGDRVGLVARKSAAVFTAILGIMKARAVYVPIDWSAPAERSCTILADCGVGVAFIDSDCREAAAAIETIVPFGGAEWDRVLQHPAAALDSSERREDDVAYILYTSGSTGIPKGVTLTHRNAISYVDWCSEVFTPTPEDRFSSHAPFHFDLSILDLYVPLKHGASVHLISDDLGKSPKPLAEFITSRALTVWYSTPAVLALLAEFGGIDRVAQASLRLVLFAGEVFPVKQLRRLTLRWPHAAYYNLYGPTETNVCTYARIPLPIPETRTQPYPIGWPCSHCDTIVLGADGEPAPAGEEGALHVSGPSVFAGYWGRPTETNAVFLQREGVRWYNTGDVVRPHATEGYLYAGRRDRMVKRRGYRIELDDIQTCLYRHPGIAGAVAIATHDPDAGTRIIAWLVAAAGHQPSIVEMKAFCVEHLPSYMSPDVFVFLDDLPRTSTNKVDYQALTQAAATRVPAAAAAHH